MRARRFDEIATRALRIESRTNLLFSFEKMALRDAVRMDDGSRAFGEGLYDFLYGGIASEARFNRWCAVVGSLPRRDLRDLAPRDMIDIQSFLWVQGSEEYRGRTFRAAQTTRIRS